MSSTESESLKHQLASALRRLRRAHGFTLQEVAVRMGKKPSAGTQIGRWERAEASPSAVELWRCLLAMDFSFGNLDYELRRVEPTSSRLREIAAELDAMGR